MPRKEYKTLTLREDVYKRFITLANKHRKQDYQIYHSQFLKLLLDAYEKKSK